MDMKKNKPVKQKIRVTTFVILFFFLGLMAIGISMGEPSRVLDQATQICLSCIGIG